MSDRVTSHLSSISFFNNFSAEILLCIVRNIRDARDLASLARVSLRLNQIATKALYENLKVDTLGQAEKLVNCHELYLSQPKVLHVANFARSLDICLKHGNLEPKAGLSSSAARAHALAYRSPGSCIGEKAIIAYLIRACTSEQLQSLSLSFGSASLAIEHSCYSKIIDSAGLRCRKLTLSGCNYDAIPELLSVMGSSLETIVVHDPICVPTCEEVRATRSNASEAMDRLELQLPRVCNMTLRACPLFEDLPLSKAVISAAPQLEELVYTGLVSLPVHRSTCLKDEDYRESNCVFLQCECSLLKVFKFSDLSAQTLAHVWSTAPIEEMEGVLFEVDESIISGLPSTLKHLQIYGLSYEHDPPMELVGQLHRLKNLVSAPELAYISPAYKDNDKFWDMAIEAEIEVRKYFSSRNPPISTQHFFVHPCDALPDSDEDSDGGIVSGSDVDTYENLPEESADTWNWEDEREDAIAFNQEAYPSEDEFDPQEYGDYSFVVPLVW
ncbi:hypothetical protein P389DRAFT_197256 [Cystobasidium minutum MCA 4210]|uniref:uncharacterized protein n=1 Tax=Cystobasidium minutum MCA 4210 TaxID=1397322 RepID=UPI0034CE48AD|eukprot:jgi/Rhomi1/197256/gm1.5470_g